MRKDNRVLRPFRPGPAGLIVLCCALAVMPLTACGKKSPPTLKSYERPAAPAVTGAAYREDAVIVSWRYPEDLRSGLSGFRVIRSGETGEEAIGSVPPDRSSFTDRSFKVGSDAAYMVIAEDLRGVTSMESNRVILRPLPLPPPPEKISFSIGANSLVLSWDSAGRDVCYNIYRTLEMGRYSDPPLNRMPLCETGFVERHLTPDQTVYYTVRPVKRTGETTGEGFASREVEVTPSLFFPPPPADLRVARTEERIFLVWQESPAVWVRGYRVYRKAEGEPAFRVIGESRVPSFTDPYITGGYVQYLIRALGPVRESEPLAGEVR